MSTPASRGLNSVSRTSSCVITPVHRKTLAPLLRSLAGARTKAIRKRLVS
jgi:hypothetical protein